MSRDAGDPRPPRRPRPKPPPTPSEEVDDTASTFRPARPDSPNPERPGRPAQSKGRRSSVDPSTGGKAPREVSGGPGGVERILFGRVSTTHLATFCRQFANYLDAGVDLLRSLASLETQFRRSALGPVLARVQLSVQRGDSLAEALSKEPQAFDRLMLSMVRVAEARGGVPEVFRQMADHYDARQRLYRQARSALIYPTFVILMALGIGAFLSFVVLPLLVGLLEDMARGRSVVLPWPTRALMAFSHFVAMVGWWLLPLLVVGTIVGLFYFYRTPPGKALLDRASLYIPVLGALLRKLDTTRFARTLSALLEAGLDFDSSLRLTSDVLHLTPYRKAVDRARVEVLNGRELSEALRDSRRFSVDVIEIVNSGEETGKLPESLARLADDYEEQVAFMVKNLGQLIQPVLIIGLGGIVLFIVLAFVMAYISVLSEIPGGL